MRKHVVLSGNYMKCIQFLGRKIQVEETTCETKVNIKMSSKERGYGSVNWIQLAQSNSTVLWIWLWILECCISTRHFQEIICVAVNLPDSIQGKALLHKGLCLIKISSGFMTIEISKGKFDSSRLLLQFSSSLHQFTADSCYELWIFWK